MSCSKWNCGLCTFANNPTSQICEMCEMGESPLLQKQESSNSMLGSPEQKGVVGLINVGNTSFINSIIQCLIQSPNFVQYFLNNEYIEDINMTNPLGYNGNVATIFSKLLQDILSGKYKIIEPKQFKMRIDEIASRFNDNNNQQHDAFEFLSFLLNGLHEDLNQILKKAITLEIESENKSDDIIANESWINHLKRNKSIIINLFTAQQKSVTICSKCNHSSNKFIPYTILSIPIPTEKYKIIQYTLIDNNTSIIPTVYGQKILKIADIDMFKEQVANSINNRYKKNENHNKLVVYGYIHQFEKELDLIQTIPDGVIQIFCEYYLIIHSKVIKETLFVCDIWKSKIHRELRRHDAVNDINRKSDDIFIYHSCPITIYNDDDEAEKEKTKINGIGNKFNSTTHQTFVINNEQKIISKQQYINHRDINHPNQTRYENVPFGFPLLITLPINIQLTMNEIRNQLLILIKPLLHNEHLEIDDNDDNDDNDLPFSLWTSWGFNNREEIRNNKDLCDLKRRHLKFVVDWKHPNEYKSELYNIDNRVRDISAPLPLEIVPVNRNEKKSIDLTQCIEALNEEILSENDGLHCSKCNELNNNFTFKKRNFIWNCPDLLIIHLKRFIYTRQWRDSINTLVRFPLNALNLSPYLLCEDAKNDSIYDLYAITNYEKDNQYSAYTKNLYNSQWYHLEDDRVSRVENINNMISPAAFILYYHKRKKPTTNIGHSFVN